MKYYITYPINEATTSNNDYRIVKVDEVDEANFLEDYGGEVIVCGNSLQEAMIAFAQFKKQ